MENREQQLEAALREILDITEGMYVEFVDTEARLRDAESRARKLVPYKTKATDEKQS